MSHVMRVLGIVVVGAGVGCGGGGGGGPTGNPPNQDPRADLQIINVSGAPDPVTAGSATPLTISIEIFNAGPDNATAGALSILLPVDLTFVAASGGGVLGGGAVTWSLGSVPSGSTLQRTATVTVDAAKAAGPMTVTATVTSTTGDPSSGNNSGSTTVTIDPAIENEGAGAVGPLGGVVSTPNGNASIVVPSGAVAGAPANFTVAERHPSLFPDVIGRESNIFELGPEATDFALPLTVSIALPEGSVGEPATLWTLDEGAGVWEEVPHSFTTAGRVWGQTTHFSVFTAALTGNQTACTNRGFVGLRLPGTIMVAGGLKDQAQLIASGSPQQQEQGARWIVGASPFTVSGNAGPPAGQGKWIDFATGPNFETGTFDIGPNGAFSFNLDIPPLGFRFLGLTDTCLADVATPTSGWYYNLEVWCGDECPDGGGGGNVPGCSFPSTVTMQPNSTWIETFFGFLENQACNLGPNPGLTRALVFRSLGADRTVTAIAGVNQWEFLGTTHGGSGNPDGFLAGLPEATDITLQLRDRFNPQGPTYELTFRFDGTQFTVVSFVQL